MANSSIYSQANKASATLRFVPDMNQAFMYPNASAKYLYDNYPEMWKRGHFLVVAFCYDTNVLAAKYHGHTNLMPSEKNLVASMLGQAAEAWAVEQGWAEKKNMFRRWLTRHRQTFLQGPRDPAMVTLASFRALAAAAEQRDFALPARPARSRARLSAATMNQQAGSTAIGTGSAVAGPVAVSVPALVAPLSAATMNPPASSSTIGTSSTVPGPGAVSAPVALSAPVTVSAPQQSLSMAAQPPTVASVGGNGTAVQRPRPTVPSRRREPIRPLRDVDRYSDSLESVSRAPDWVKQVARLVDNPAAFKLIMESVKGRDGIYYDRFYVVKKDGRSSKLRDAETRSIRAEPCLGQLYNLAWIWYRHLRRRTVLARQLETDPTMSDYHLELKGSTAAIRRHLVYRDVYRQGPQSIKEKHHWTMICFEAIKMMLGLEVHVEAEILRLEH